MPLDLSTLPRALQMALSPTTLYTGITPPPPGLNSERNPGMCKHTNNGFQSEQFEWWLHNLQKKKKKKKRQNVHLTVYL